MQLNEIRMYQGEKVKVYGKAGKHMTVIMKADKTFALVPNEELKAIPKPKEKK
jgi:hypothetical protein